jgi:hypothetical protein
MPVRTTPARTPFDPTVERQPDPRHIFDRDPLLVPKLFVDLGPPWYKRGWWRGALVASIVAVMGLGLLVAIKGPHQAKLTLQRVGVDVMHVYTRLVASPDFKNNADR